jgi:solute carrier family 35 protein F1/2
MNTQEKEKVEIVQTEELQTELQTDTISEPVTDARKTIKDRFAFLKNPNFYKVLILGQVLSLCITGTNVISTKLNVSYQFSAPTMQTFLI